MIRNLSHMIPKIIFILRKGDETMKHWGKIGILICTILFSLIACQKPTQKDTLMAPIHPETFISDLVNNTENAYELSVLPWFLPEQDVKRVMKDYERITEDTQGKTLIYRITGNMKNGEEVIEEIYLGISTKASKFFDAHTLGLVNINFYLEKEETAKELADILYGEAKELASVQQETPFMETDTLVMYKKESGSYLSINYLGALIPEEAAAKKSPWNKTYGIRVLLWMPVPQNELML